LETWKKKFPSYYYSYCVFSNFKCAGNFSRVSVIAS
jgi:hypothetical protein